MTLEYKGVVINLVPFLGGLAYGIWQSNVWAGITMLMVLTALSGSRFNK